MKLIREVFESDFVLDSIETDNYDVKKASRAVIFDNENKIAILDVNNGECYKIPWWWLKHWEDHIQALHREVMEEWGVFIEIIQEIGQVLEHRYSIKKKIINNWYIAKVKWKKCLPQFTKKEIALGFQIKWFDIDTAIQLMQNSKSSDSITQLRQQRELEFVLEARKLMSELRIGTD